MKLRNIILVIIPLLGLINLTQGESKILLEKRTLHLRGWLASVLTVHKKVLITDQRGKSKLGNVIIHVPASVEIDDIEGEIYDLDGNSIKELDRDNVRKWNGNFDSKIYGKDKFYLFNLKSSRDEYIVEYSFKKKYNSLYFFRGWFPQQNFPVDKAIFQIKAPQKKEFKIKTLGNMPEPVKKEEGNILRWKLDSISKLKDEYRDPPESKKKLGLKFVPSEFKVKGIKGTYDSWGALGNFIEELVEDQYELKDEAVQEIGIDSSQTERGIIKQVYNYIQNNMRYLSMEEGHYGMKPHKAQEVFEKKYGDCKDLSTLMIAILKKFNIEAYPTLVRTRDNGPVDRDFPQDVFNHFICCIPRDNDTLWIDCTSKSAPIDDLPPSDEGSYVLVVENGKGNLVKTPMSKARDNVLKSTAQIKINKSGNAQVTGNIVAKGNKNQMVKGSLASIGNEKKTKVLEKVLGDYTPSINLDSLEFTNLQKNDKKTKVTFSCESQKYTNVSSSRLFLNPAFFNRLPIKGEKPTKRQNAVVYLTPYTKKDSIVYTIPDNYKVETLPESVNLDFSFGHYSYTINEKEGKYIFERKIKIKERTIPKNKYSEYYKFRQKIDQADDNMMVFKKEKK